MSKKFKFSSGVLLELNSVESISTVQTDPSGKTFSIWVEFKGRPKESYRYLLGASEHYAQLQYSDLCFQLSGCK